MTIDPLAGNWSADPPTCRPIKCRALEILDAHLRVLSLNNSFEGHATFLCPFGYKLVGKESIKCGPRGHWDSPVPKCEGKILMSRLEEASLSCLLPL